MIQVWVIYSDNTRRPALAYQGVHAYIERLNELLNLELEVFEVDPKMSFFLQ